MKRCERERNEWLLLACIAGVLGCGTQTAPSEPSADPGKRSVAAPARDGAAAASDVPGADQQSAAASGGEDEGVLATQAKPNPGGQSGTDQAVQACASDRHPIAPDDASKLGWSALEVLATLEAALAASDPLVVHWNVPALGVDSDVTVELLGHDDDAVLVGAADDALCRALGLPISLRVRSADGVLDAVFEGDLLGSAVIGHPEVIPFSFDGAVSDVAATAGSLVQRLEASVRPGTLSAVYLQLGGGTLNSGRAQAFPLGGVVRVEPAPVEQTAAELGTITVDHTPRAPAIQVYQLPAAFEALCAQAQPTLPLVFTSPDAELASMTGRWLLCAGQRTAALEHAGIEIAADGRWKHLTERNGELVDQLGFGHEGIVEVLDTSSQNGPGATELIMYESAPGESSPALELAADGRTMHLHHEGALDGPAASSLYIADYIYVATDLPVGAAQPLRERGERAGAAACTEGEAYVSDSFTSEDAVRAALVGAWTVCVGGLAHDAAGISFAADGSYRHLAADGSEVKAGHYEIDDISAPTAMSAYYRSGKYEIVLRDDDGAGVYSLALPLMSAAPLKLKSYNEAELVLSAMP